MKATLLLLSLAACGCARVQPPPQAPPPVRDPFSAAVAMAKAREAVVAATAPPPAGSGIGKSLITDYPDGTHSWTNPATGNSGRWTNQAPASNIVLYAGPRTEMAELYESTNGEWRFVGYVSRWGPVARRLSGSMAEYRVGPSPAPCRWPVGQ